MLMCTDSQIEDVWQCFPMNFPLSSWDFRFWVVPTSSPRTGVEHMTHSLSFWSSMHGRISEFQSSSAHWVQLMLWKILFSTFQSMAPWLRSSVWLSWSCGTRILSPKSILERWPFCWKIGLLMDVVCILWPKLGRLFEGDTLKHMIRWRCKIC